MYGEHQLKRAVMEYIDHQFQDLIEDNLLEYLSFDEIYEILERPRLCVYSQWDVCSAMMKWIHAKRCPDSEDDQELTKQLVTKLRSIFPAMSDYYFQKPIHQLSMSKNNNPLSPVQCQKSHCQNCIFLMLWSRDEKSIQGLDMYLEERKEEQSFMFWNMSDKRNCRELTSMKDNGRSYFQHYGPIKRKNGVLVNCDSYIFYLGGSKMTGNVSKKSHDYVVSDAAFVYDTSSLEWLRMTSRLPLRMTRFGALFIHPYLYIIGGLSDEPFGSPYLLNSRKFSISRSIYRIHHEDWFSSSGVWKHLYDLPHDRINFSVVSGKKDQICLVSNDAVDVLDLSQGTWRTIPLETSRQQNHGKGKPVAVILGTFLYIIHGKSDTKGPNTMWQIDLSQEKPIWQPLFPVLDLRFDPIQAFTHNNGLYVIGNQTASGNFAYRFDPIVKEWSLQLEGFSGHFLPHAGILLRKQLVRKPFFDGCSQRN